MPTPAPPPRTPQPDSFAAQQQADETRRLALAKGGSQANIVSDLTSNQVSSARPVLNPIKSVTLGN
jgi:hypothetical protein